jgi:hypothetical protein
MQDAAEHGSVKTILFFLRHGGSAGQKQGLHNVPQAKERCKLQGDAHVGLLILVSSAI